MKSKKIQTTFLKIFILLVGIIAGSFFYVHHQLSPVNAHDDQVQTIEIPTGATRADIADLLKQKGLIRSAFIFQYYVRFAADASKFNAGLYDIAPSMSAKDIAHLLEEGQSKEAYQARLIIREGVDIEEIADLLEKETRFSKKEFMATIQDPAFISQLVDKYPQLLKETSEKTDTRYILEGYLFPKTYLITVDTTLEGLIDEMVHQSQLIFEKYQTQFANSQQSIHEIFTLASLIEREAVHDEDRARISGVFYNRLKESMPLQTDVSVIYALGTHKTYITLEDIEVDSPYNTYKNLGLMPGPVNNPSESAIVAALEPESNDYLYFLADIKTGNVYFSKTYEEHMEYQKKYVPSEAPKDNE